MRTGLPVAFLAQLARKERAPRQLLEFEFASGTVYVSDQTYGADLANAYEALVENWGTMEETSDLQNLLTGINSGTRQMSTSILNKGSTPFSSRFNTESPENVPVKHYQWFDGIAESDKVLIDEMVIQDPISYSEASLLLNLDLVSSNQYANPYLGQLSSGDNNFYGVVIGEVTNAPSTAYGTRPIVELSADITDSAATILCTTDPLAAGFAASGTIVLDYEQINYTGISGNSFTGCTRGVSAGADWSAAFAHKAGQKVFKYNHEYLYSFGQGPLDVMGPVKVNDVVYTGAHTIYKDLNPVQVGFLHGDPFEKVAGSTVATKTITGFYPDAWNDWGRYSPVSWYNMTAAAVGTDDTTYSTLEGTTNDWDLSYSMGYIIFRNDSAWGSGYRSHSELVREFFAVKGQHEGHGGLGPVLGIESYTQTLTEGYSSSGWDDVVESYDTWQPGARTVTVTAMVATASANNVTRKPLQVDLVTLTAEYKPYIKNYSTDITCYLSSGTGNTNPAEALTAVLSIMGVAGYIDSSSFDVARDWFTTNSYAFNGFVPGDMRCRDVLATMCQQSRARLLYGGGVIKLIIREHLADKSVDKIFTRDRARQKSIRVVRQSVQDILNKITIRYSASDVQADYAATVTVSDATSQATFGLQEAVWDFFLIDDATLAGELAAFYLAELKDPYVFLTFTAWLDAFPLEIDDCVCLGTDFSGLKSFIGDVAQISRVFGSGKLKSINHYEITIKSAGNSMIDGALSDNIAITDTVTGYLDPAGYGRGWYGSGGYGA